MGGVASTPSPARARVNYRYKMRKPRKPCQFQKYLDTIKIKDVLINPRPAGPLDFPPPAGGGGGV